MSELKFANKSVVVTGAGSGIGRAVAQAFASAGASLTLCDIDATALRQTADALRADAHSHESSVATQLLDVRNPASCRQVIATAVEQFGGIDVLCNSAGIARCAYFTDIAVEDWQAVIDTNLNGVFHLSQAVIPHLLERGGCIVNLASVAGLKGQAYTAAYCASKFAVIGLTQSLALEYAQQGLRVNAVCPGGTDTAMVAGFMPPPDADPALMARYLPLTEMAEAEDIAQVILFLSSERARHINGVALPVDGGVCAG